MQDQINARSWIISPLLSFCPALTHNSFVFPYKSNRYIKINLSFFLASSTISFHDISPGLILSPYLSSRYSEGTGYIEYSVHIDSSLSVNKQPPPCSDV